MTWNKGIPLIPEAMPGKPPKWYNKDKSIGLFLCGGPDHCVEMVRGTIGSKGDIYVFPTPLQVQKHFPFHESFHTSGEFHWKMRGEKIIPICGPEDAPAAFRAAFFKFGQTPCFCFRRGKRLSSNEIRFLVRSLIKYVPLIIDTKKVISALEKDGFYRAPRPDLAMLEEALKKKNP